MHSNVEKEALDAAAEPSDPSTFTAANGLKLKLKRVSQMIIADANRKLVAPQPPVMHNPDKGRDEPNPLDPAYIKAIENFNYETSMLAMKVYFILGTEPIQPLPRDLEPPAAPAWAENIAAAYDDIDIPESGPRRYLAWLKYYALPNEDQVRLFNAIIRFSGGTLEADVRAAQESFPDQQARDTTPRVLPAPEDQGGDHYGVLVGGGTRIRNEGSGDVHPHLVG